MADPKTDPSNPIDPKEPVKEPAKPEAPDDTKGRITDLVKQKKELEAKLKEYDDAKKKGEEEKLVEQGKLKELLQAKEKELGDLTGMTAKQKEKLESYEKIATEHVKDALKAITDEEKRKDAQALLEGRDLADQFKLIPTILKLAGTEAKSFGNSTPPGEKKAGTTDIETKKARYAELLGKATLAPQERAEKNRLMNELSEVWKKEQKEQKEKAQT